MIETPGGGEGHIGPAGDSEPAAVTSYVLVDDLDATAGQIVAAGGSVTQPRQDVPEQGAFLWFTAPGGERMVAWQNA